MEYRETNGYVSQSMLKILEKDIVRFKNQLDGNDIEEKTKYLDYGTYLHMRVLEPDKFEETIAKRDCALPNSQAKIKFSTAIAEGKDLLDAYKLAYTVKDSDKKVEDKANALLAECSDYIEHIKNSENKTYLDPKVHDRILSTVDNIKRHKKASKLMENSILNDDEYYNEYPIFWECNGVKCKSLIDRVIINKTEKTIKLIDVKTTSNIGTFSDSFKNYGYAFQLAFYSMAIRYCKELTGIQEDKELDDWNIEFYIVAADSITAEVKVFSVTQDTVSNEFPTIKSLLERAKWHIDNNLWDGSMEYYIGDGTEEL